MYHWFYWGMAQLARHLLLGCILRRNIRMITRPPSASISPAPNTRPRKRKRLFRWRFGTLLGRRGLGLSLSHFIKRRMASSFASIAPIRRRLIQSKVGLSRYIRMRVAIFRESSSPQKLTKSTKERSAESRVSSSPNNTASTISKRPPKKILASTRSFLKLSSYATITKSQNSQRPTSRWSWSRRKVSNGGSLFRLIWTIWMNLAKTLLAQSPKTKSANAEKRLQSAACSKATRVRMRVYVPGHKTICILDIYKK